MKKLILYRFLIFLGILSLYFPIDGFSQEINNKFIVEGKVVNPQGEKAVGATVVIKGTTIGTVTDVDGFFTISIPSDEATLIIQHYSTSEVWEDSFEAGKKYIIRLVPDAASPIYPVFDRVDELPRPAIGDDGWYTFLAKNMKYSKLDRENGVEGTVIIGFDVREDGSLDRVAILRGIG
ncbi:carboxypeptidase-like regulatory domain-containing protein [Algoriphagus confluentis]|uniref:TonB C-terminal domain-containing protein n=1 Tax=Algoriphagus confluentis TaxID=1697556 RepID=A0ABQ6PK59_9BACT|nr:hypothetical protein Aconfl_03120 [Algoriphagus confluentis]